MKSLGQIAYEAYYSHAEGQSLISGVQLPDWHEQGLAVQEAWEIAAQAVKSAISIG